MDADVASRAALHAALAEPIRLAIVDLLAISDRSPKELGAMLDLGSNLLTHHLDVLAGVGLIERFTSAGDRRRRYVTLCREPLAELGIATARPAGEVLFVCSHNAARSQLAAALWTDLTGEPARSAGTTPAEQVHPGAVDAAARRGLDLGSAIPTRFGPGDDAAVVVTVCDRAHEELEVGEHWWHWSIPDPSISGSDAAFDAAVADLERRIRSVA
ncbi:MAG: ArsR family transcriptional regulator [Actinomycetota bacterium]